MMTLVKKDCPRGWAVTYDDYDADMWGFSIFVTPPCFGNTMIDFSCRTGDMEGRFTNHAVDPASMYFGQSFTGRADFDRDEFELGATYPIPGISWLYARAELFWSEEEGDWDYGGGEIETQEYDMWDWSDWGVQGRVGARVSYPIQESMDVFLGIGYEYLETDDGGLDMTTDGFFASVGVKGEW